MNKRLLLHTCCAPCLSGVYYQLPDYDVTAYFYNPNIAQPTEYTLRYQELLRYCSSEKITLISEEYGSELWFELILPYRFLGEKSYRCEICYRMRLEKTFKRAVSDGFEIVASTLSVSPHKLAEKINAIGNQLAESYGITYLESDFKKGQGFQQSLEASKKYNFYRQNYCGCVYSQKERSKKSAWGALQKVKLAQLASSW